MSEISHLSGCDASVKYVQAEALKDRKRSNHVKDLYIHTWSLPAKSTANCKGFQVGDVIPRRTCVSSEWKVCYSGGYRGVWLEFRTLMPLRGSQWSWQRMFFRHEMSALTLCWEVWGTQMFAVLSSLLSWGWEKCHFIQHSCFLPLLLHASSQISRPFTLWRFLSLAHTKHSYAVTVLLSFRVMSLKRAQRKHHICYGYQTADLHLWSSFTPEDIWSFPRFHWWLWVIQRDCLPFTQNSVIDSIAAGHTLSSDRNLSTLYLFPETFILVLYYGTINWMSASLH